MSQSSQIYVRYNGTLIVANYYSWNYGERMISRARYGLETITDYLEDSHTFVFEDKNYIEKIRRIFDVNFDMKDIVISSNIFREWEGEWKDDTDVDFRTFVFKWQQNNDGKLLIDIKTNMKTDDTTGREVLSGYSIKYAFLDYEGNVDNIMSTKQYAEWDIGKEWATPTEYLTQEDISVCYNNIVQIGNMAQLMSKKEVNDFLDTSKYRFPDGTVRNMEGM